MFGLLLTGTDLVMRIPSEGPSHLPVLVQIEDQTKQELSLCVFPYKTYLITKVGAMYDV
jgi:hypothetical protein